MALTAKQARGLVDAALKAAEERGYLIGVAVVDAGGNLVWSGRMDGARYLTPDVVAIHTWPVLRCSTTRKRRASDRRFVTCSACCSSYSHSGTT